MGRCQEEFRARRNATKAAINVDRAIDVIQSGTHFAARFTSAILVASSASDTRRSSVPSTPKITAQVIITGTVPSNHIKHARVKETRIAYVTIPSCEKILLKTPLRQMVPT